MPYDNVLLDFATYNCLWTMAAVTPAELNSGNYRNELDKVIFSSAGRFADERVPTAYGVPEFFVDNVEMQTYVTATAPAGNTSQIKIDFDIFEPFSMGLFLQSCQTASKLAGFNSYLDNCPYVLKLEIKGQRSDGDTFAEVGPWFFVVRLVNITFQVTESGSKYRCETVPFGDQTLNGSSNTIQNEMKLTGKTAKEALVDHPNNSLVIMLKEREKLLVKDQKKGIEDKYTIEFPDCDWGGPNPFAQASTGSFDFQPDTPGGQEKFARRGDVDGANGKIVRGKVTLNPKEKSLQFSQGTSIQAAIDSIILSTKQARDSATGAYPLDSEGMVLWWRIDADIKLLEYDERIKDYAKEFIYRVRPYKIHHSVFMGPEAKARGIENLEQNVTKEYNYIYTGKNVDVLKFNIDIKALFFTAVNPNAEVDSGDQATSSTSEKVPSKPVKTKAPEGKSEETGPEAKAPALKPHLLAGRPQVKGGSSRLDTAQSVANEFHHNVLTKSYEMINLDLDILGDPYWLPEQGMPNYRPPGDGSMLAANGTMNYKNREILVSVKFKTPLDTIGGEGIYAIGGTGTVGEEESPFSGIYRVNTVTSKFSNGQFTQSLTGNRLPAQQVKGDAEVKPATLDTEAPARNKLSRADG
jgi:hypothetical protein